MRVYLNICGLKGGMRVLSGSFTTDEVAVSVVYGIRHSVRRILRCCREVQTGN